MVKDFLFVGRAYNGVEEVLGMGSGYSIDEAFASLDDYEDLLGKYNEDELYGYELAEADAQFIDRDELATTAVGLDDPDKEEDDDN